MLVIYAMCINIYINIFYKNYLYPNCRGDNVVKVNSRWMSLEDVARIVIMEREAGRKPKKWMQELLDAKIHESGLKAGDKTSLDGREYLIYKTMGGSLNFKKLPNKMNIHL